MTVARAVYLRWSSPLIICLLGSHQDCNSAPYGHYSDIRSQSRLVFPVGATLRSVSVRSAARNYDKLAVVLLAHLNRTEGCTETSC